MANAIPSQGNAEDGHKIRANYVKNLPHAMNERHFQACAQRKQAAETVDLASWQSTSAARLLPIRTENSFTPTQPLCWEGAMSSSTHIPKIDTHPMLMLIPMSSMSNKFGLNTSSLSCLRILALNPLPANSYVKIPSLIDYNEERQLLDLLQVISYWKKPGFAKSSGKIHIQIWRSIRAASLMGIEYRAFVLLNTMRPCHTCESEGSWGFSAR